MFNFDLSYVLVMIEVLISFQMQQNPVTKTIQNYINRSTEECSVHSLQLCENLNTLP